MQKQPESPQHPRPSTNGEHQGTSLAIDPETANQDNTREGRDEIPQKDTSGTALRSMPWPETPSARPSTPKKPAPRPTKPSLDDEWLASFQEPEPAFPSNLTGQKPAPAPYESPKTPSQNKQSRQPVTAQNREDEWATESRKPQQSSSSPSSALPAHDVQGNAASPTLPATAINPPDPLTSIPPTQTIPITPPPLTPPMVLQATASPVHDPLPPPEAIQLPTAVPAPITPSAAISPQATASSPIPANPPFDDEWAASLREQANAPNAPSYAPVPAPQTPEAPTPFNQAGPITPPPLTPPMVPQAGATPVHHAPPTAIPNPTAAPAPITPLDRMAPISPQSAIPHADSTAPILPAEGVAASTSLSNVAPTPESSGSAPHEPPPPFSEVQALMRPPAPPAPTLIGGSLDTQTPTPAPAPPSLKDQWAVGLGEQKDANTPNTVSYSPVSTSPTPAMTSTTKTSNPMPPLPNAEPISTHAQPAQVQTSTTTVIPPAPLAVPPGPGTPIPSLDDEWVASQNETQDESAPPVVSSPTNFHVQGSTALKGSPQPQDLATPHEITRASQPGTSTSKLQPHPPENSMKQNAISPQPNAAEHEFQSTKNPASHVVQAWPSARSVRASSKSPSPHGTIQSESSDAEHSLATHTLSSFDTEGFDPVKHGEEGYAPFRIRHPFFTGNGGTLFGIFTTNTVRTLLTLGMYSFWGRINIRRYLHSQTKFAGGRFAFHGTGGELLLGWIKALVAFGIPYSALNYVSSQHTEAIWQWSLNGLAGLLVACFIPVAIVGSHRYRMSRTSWRSIRFSFQHSAAAFTVLYLKGALLSLVTLGIYYPIFDHARRAFLTSGTHFGNQDFGFDGDPKILGQLYFQTFRRLVLTLVAAEVFLLLASFLATQFRPEQVVDLVFLSSVGAGTIVIPILLGLWFWFQAAKQRYMWNHTTFGPSRFRATMKGRHLFELKCTNLILLVISLGLAWPWVQKRNLQFLYYHLGFRGPLGLQHILQQATSASPMGEELAGFFDAGFEM